MERIRQEWEAFRALPFGKKLEHIWLYYKWFLIVSVAVICMLVSIAGTVAENRKEVLVSGIFINNSTTPEGYAHLTEEFRNYLARGSDCKAELISGRTIHFDAEPLSQEDAAAFMIVSSMIAAGTLDYIITDASSLDHFVEQEVVMDLRQLLSEEELAGWDTIEHGSTVTALRLTDTAFCAQYPLSAPDSCILVIGNAPHQENLLRFMDYLRNEP